MAPATTPYSIRPIRTSKALIKLYARNYSGGIDARGPRTCRDAVLAQWRIKSDVVAVWFANVTMASKVRVIEGSCDCTRCIDSRCSGALPLGHTCTWRINRDNQALGLGTCSTTQDKTAGQQNISDTSSPGICHISQTPVEF